MGPHPSFFLIGPMGCGKSTVGKALADRLDCRFYDSDAEIERRAGSDIATIFEREGEAAFRRREEQVIESLTRKDGIVLATGGGAVLSKRNRCYMASRGTVVFLETEVETQLSRVSIALETRPLLRRGNPAETLEKLYAERKPFYEEMADIVVSTDDVSVEQLADKIINAFLGVVE